MINILMKTFVSIRRKKVSHKSLGLMRCIIYSTQFGSELLIKTSENTIKTE